MKRIAVEFSSDEEVEMFVNRVMNDEEYRIVIDLFPTDKKVCCVAKKKEYNEDLMPSISMCLSELGLEEVNLYEY